MRDQDLEQRLRTAAEHAAPDPLDRILSSCDTQKGTVTSMNTTPQKKKKRWVPLATAAALLIMCTGVLGANQWRTATAVASVVCLDVMVPAVYLLFRLAPQGWALWVLRFAAALFGFLYILDFKVKKPVLWKFIAMGAAVVVPLVILIIWFPA